MKLIFKNLKEKIMLDLYKIIFLCIFREILYWSEIYFFVFWKKIIEVWVKKEFLKSKRNVNCIYCKFLIFVYDC